MIMYDIKAFDESVLAAFQPVFKIGLLATVTPEGLPHITLTSSLRAATPKKLVFGEFCGGKSKRNLENNPKAAFLVLTGDRRIYRGHAGWSHSRAGGPEYDEYCGMPFFSGESCFSVSRVHYLDLVDARGPEFFPARKRFFTAVLSRPSKQRERASAGDPEKQEILSCIARRIMNRPDAIGFMAFVKKDGFPEIVPLLQCRPSGGDGLVLFPFSSREEPEEGQTGKRVSVLCITKAMESVLLGGFFSGFRRRKLLKCGLMEIDTIYNSMPPASGRIYPPEPLEGVTHWGDFPLE